MEYFNNKTINKYISIKLSNYVNFDVKRIFDLSDHIYIYGGALRDILSNNKINDLDITGLPKSLNRLHNFLIDEGFKESEDMIDMELYDDSIINMPFTLIKDDTKIQIIRPKFKTPNINSELFDFMSNVDISCCGLYFDGNIIRESVNFALTSCIIKKCWELKGNYMYSEKRFKKRKTKHKNKGFSFYKKSPPDDFNEQFEDSYKTFIKSINRENIIDEIL